jgi:sterol 3beta-glucosyltransferase
MDFSKKKVRDEVIQRLKDAVLVVRAAAIAVDDSITGKPFTTPPMSTPRLSEDTTSSYGLSQQDSTGTSTPATSVGGLPSPSASSMSQPYVVKPLVEVWNAPHRTHLLGQKMDEEVKLPPGLPATALPKIIGSVGSKKLSGLHFVCLTIGSRGDVQPYISLGLELMKDGNRFVPLSLTAWP